MGLKGFNIPLESSKPKVIHSDLGPGTCDLRPGTCDLRPVTCDLGPGTCDLRPATCDLGPVTCVLYLPMRFVRKKRVV